MSPLAASPGTFYKHIKAENYEGLRKRRSCIRTHLKECIHGQEVIIKLWIVFKAL